MSKHTPIRAGLKEGSRLQGLVEDGLKALKKADRARIDDGLRAGFGDSLDIDAAFRESHPGGNRWDYLLGDSNSKKVVGIEPHSAHDKEVKTVIAKRKAALGHLREHWRPGVQVADWFWIASGKVDFTAHDKAVRELEQNGIRFVSKQLLARDLPQDDAKVTSRARRQPKR